MILTAVALLLPPPLTAQDGGPGGHRKWLYAAAGAVLLGVPAYLSEDFDFRLGGCGAAECFAPLAAVAGATTGFLIGLERDEAAARRFVAGPAAEPEVRALDLEVVPQRLVPHPDGVVVLGDRGLLRAGTDLEAEPLSDVRGVRDLVVLPAHDVFLATTGASLFAFPLAGGGGGREVLGTGGTALVGVGPDRLVLGGEGSVRLLGVSGGGDEATVDEVARAPTASPPRALAWSGGAPVVWQLDGERLTARSLTTLEALGRVQLPGAGRALAVDGGIGVVAAGDAGVFVVDLSDPARPEVVGRYEGVGYAFDVALEGTTAWIAAGEQGAVRLDLTEPFDPAVTGVARNLGAPISVLRSEDGLFLLDRSNRRLYVVENEEWSRP